MEKKRVSASSSDIAELADKQSKMDALHAKAMTMFAQLDTDGNGVIDRWADMAHLSMHVRRCVDVAVVIMHALDLFDTPAGH
jgi:hypothetical protein